MKLTDTLAKILQENSINHVFGLQGGAVVHIFDSIEKKKNMMYGILTLLILKVSYLLIV